MRLLALIFLLGCTQAFAPQHAAEAVSIVWTSYKAVGEPPSINWLLPECVAPKGQHGIPLPGTDECVASYYEFPPEELAVIAWVGQFHNTGLAHELMNSVDCRSNPNCLDEQFMMRQYLVDKANASLAAAGY
jgi:hypothetical protein